MQLSHPTVKHPTDNREKVANIPCGLSASRPVGSLAADRAGVYEASRTGGLARQEAQLMS